MAATTQVCPIVGTTNTVLPPSHPEFNMDEPGLVCPVVGASTDHHKNLSRHPGIPGASSKDLSDASACPALKQSVKEPEAQAMDEAVCPVVGTVSSVLPPDHPSTANNKAGDICPVTKASLGHHEGKVHDHPTVANAPKGAVCPVVGKGRD